MYKILMVGAGGFIGAVMRYTVGGFAQKIFKSAGFPIGTLTVNIIGCLLIGFFMHMNEMRNVFSESTRLLIFVGIFGGFTTYSAFGNETVNLMNGGKAFLGFANIGLHIILGLGAVWLGRLLSSLSFS